VYLGRRWWPPFALIGAAVLMVLLLAPDAYVAFGLIFGAIIVGALTWPAIGNRLSGIRTAPGAQPRGHATA
jgi:hypothetical protein